MPSTLDPSNNSLSSSSSRKSLIERLASLRIQSNSTSPSQTTTKTTSKAPESPRYIPRSAQSTTTTKSKFYNYPQTAQQGALPNEMPSSPTIGRRRKLTGNTGITSANTTNSTNLTCPIDSPKYFPKQKFIEIEGKVSKFPEISEEISENVTEIERKHSVVEVVTSFIDSFTILNNFLTKSSNSTTAKLHLQNMNTSFAALQMDLKAAVSQLNNEGHKCEIDSLKSENASLKSDNDELKAENSSLKSDNSQMINNNSDVLKRNQELEEQLKIALNQIAEIKIAFDKEKENVEFLQNYMEEIIQLKDEGEQKMILMLERGKNKETPDLIKENENLKETINLLEMERLSRKKVCEEALQLLDSKENLEELKQELKLKHAEIEKLKGREKHFKESNEIFQQKLLLLTEENRKLRGQRPLNHY